uniref:M protein repeat protein n=1 Tax=Haemonchus contortus TaxID=6289 RepID=A0A7I5E7D6_HAECO
MYHGGTVSDDDEDHSSEATMNFNAKMTAKFRKAFPLRSESNLRRPTPIATPSLAQISKRLNFDDSFNTSTVNNTNAKLSELREEVVSLKRQLNNAENSIERLKASEKSAKDHANQLQLEISTLRKELIKQSHSMDIENAKNELNKVLHSRDEWREASTRFHRYFQCAKARLITAENELRRRGLLNENMKMTLTHAWTATECNTQNIQDNLCDLLRNASTTLEELDRSSEEQEEVEKYMRSLTKKNASDYDGNEDSDSNDTAMIFEEPEEAVIRDSISPIVPTSLEAEQSTMSESILNSTFANTSIDYEKDERIQRLELENSRMQDRLNLLRDRAQKSMLMEEQKNNAEQKYSLLEKNMEKILAEHQSLQTACAKKLFDFPEKTSQGRSTEIIKRIQDLNGNVETLQEQLRGSRFEIESSKKEIEALRRERDALLRKLDQITAINEDLKNSLYVEKERCSDLTRTTEEKNSELQTCQKELSAVRSEIKVLEEKLVEAQSRTAHLEVQLRNASREPTDAGDETQIIHLRNNPLQCAVDAYSEAEKERLRKRKAETTFDGGEPCEAKRAREEHISALEAQLKKSEREKEQTIRLQKDLAKKYREITTTLTGYQIKLKDADEGICYVNSVYDETEKQFVFKFNTESGIVDLLDVSQDSLSQGRPWEEEMQKYIGERHSIPGFLAAVTLQLEARRNTEDVERTHTFTVMQEH